MHSFAGLAKKSKSKNTWLKKGDTEKREDKEDTPAELDDLLAEWTEIQRQACEAQVGLLKNYLENHQAKLQEVLKQSLEADGKRTPRTPRKSPREPEGSLIVLPEAKSKEVQGPLRGLREPTSPPPPVGADDGDVHGDDTIQDPATKDAIASSASNAEDKVTRQQSETEATYEDLQDQLEELGQQEEMLDMWRRSDGMHTVDKWCTNYLKHPAGWGALLMIHGIPEVTGRLRSKVENYAIYSALFLSVSMSWLADPPDHVTEACDYPIDTFQFWECEIQKRAFAYFVGFGTGAHMLSILLAMNFINVLNEAARDSDVIRMFARGKGFLATVKVQYLFRIGCVADFLGMIVAAKIWVGWDIIAIAILLIIGMYRSFSKTAGLLWRSAGIVTYWRSDLGGKPDADDPYSIDFPLMCLKSRTKFARSFKETAQRLVSQVQ